MAHRFFAIALISLVTLYGCGQNNSIASTERSKANPLASRFEQVSTAAQLAIFLDLSFPQQQQLEVLLDSHTAHVNILIETGPANSAEESRMEEQLEEVARAFRHEFFVLLTPLQIAAYDDKSKEVLSSYYQTGTYADEALLNFVKLVEDITD
ncbi:MAG: hypothetical protein HOC74_12470 [Gemmatimonadetes bacterium]|jgi:hypothetical protein|nr:hypothetical protein [Gemmatimonadota bacterium]MBT7912829.1 hypothetical protein [Candidatus Bathyarchaeota archaeon]